MIKGDPSMGYMKIRNLYQQADVLMFKELWALEKIHGTSAHVRWDGDKVHFFLVRITINL